MRILIAVAAIAATSLATPSLVAQSPLTTTFANNNGNAAGGMMFFDLDVSAPGGITIYKLDINTSATSGAIEEHRHSDDAVQRI